jgi:hypothetical protein
MVMSFGGGSIVRGNARHRTGLVVAVISKPTIVARAREGGRMNAGEFLT